VRERQELQRFESIVMPHFGAGYNLARWLTRNDHDAEDVVQEAYLRALRSFDRYRGGDPRSWLLTIVRNTCYTWLRQNRRSEQTPTGDHADDTWAEIAADPAGEPEAQFIRKADRRLLREALEELPAEFREAFVLRELEGCSYKEIADITDVPLGTVMSRLARARKQLQHSLVGRMKEGA
jgi:RNA polymerase sigma-70 factor (ECF subfamily)